MGQAVYWQTRCGIVRGRSCEDFAIKDNERRPTEIDATILWGVKNEKRKMQNVKCRM